MELSKTHSNHSKIIHHQTDDDSHVILGTAQITLEGENGNKITARALCDNGSQVNLISQTTIHQLGEKLIKRETNFAGVGGNSLGSALGEIWLNIKLRNNQNLNEKFYIVKSITNYVPCATNHTWPTLKNQLADKHYNQPGKIHVLLGVGIWIRIIKNGLIKSEDQTAVLHNSKLGYIVLQSGLPKPGVSYIGYITKAKEHIDLMNQIKRLWEIEEIPSIKHRTDQEEECEKIFVTQHTRNQSGRYIVRIPFNEKITKLGKSKKMALHQFFAMEGKMKKNSEFATKYKLFMSEYETLGHMEEIWEKHEEGYYTPHHGILSANKFRVVFNASAKTTSRISLNEAQLIGEKLQNDLFIILMNFRKFKHGITADIEKMYRQILIHPDDQKYQKILWRDNPQGPIKTYRLKTVTYGQTCAPHCAIRTLVQCANDNEQLFPNGASIIKNCFYVDDLLTGADNLEDAKAIKQDITTILKNGGFNITKWKVNGNFEDRELGDQEDGSVLGLFWNLREDKFFYKLKKSDLDKNIIWTKRKVLSKIGQMYDPNGFLGPVIMKGKMIIQDLWKDKYDWDQPIEGTLKEKWKVFDKDLENVSTISIKRWIGLTKGKKIQLHGFCDASEKGYGAVIYSKTKENEKYQIELLTSKSRVAPVKVVTIPRLELCAANLLVNLIKIILPLFNDIKHEIFCWSDSKTVLQWLLKPSATLKTYVANRVANIQTKTENFNITWNWVPGVDNPADLISRGTSVLELHNEIKWWNGPNWLKLSKEEWPISILLNNTEDFNDPNIQKESKVIHLMIKPDKGLVRGKWFKYPLDRQETFPIIETYGEWNKLQRVTATLLRAIYNFKNPKTKIHGILKPTELNEACKQLIKIDQHNTFVKEVKAIENNNIITHGTLVLIWDKENQCLRINGRIQSQNLTRDEQFPIVIAKEGKLANLLIRDAHFKTKHGGNQLCLQYLRSKYWIIGARTIVKNIIRKCPICFKLRMKTSEQLMASLPTYRTTPKRAFSQVGIDYAGPVIVRSALGRLPKLTKAWIAVFVCLVTRAIHLELVSDATTQAFIAALKRMVSRRGIISHIVSDNGTNFVGANNYLKAIIEQIEQNSENISEQFNFKWTFSTPSAPHHGGIYEAAVKSIKHHLVRVIGDTTLTFEEYATVLSQTEACVNSRPICTLNDDPTSINALTPGHFIIGEPLIRIPDEQDFRQVPDNRLDRWNHLQKMIQHFWDRWQDEYIGTLINRSKWITPNQNLKIGDLVVVKEDNLPPLKWKLARIQEVLPGKDNLVRSVIIKTSTGVYKRPIVKLGLLLSAKEEIID